MDEAIISELLNIVLALVAAAFMYKIKDDTKEINTANAQAVTVQNAAGSVLSLVEGIETLIADYKEKTTNEGSENELNGLSEDEMKALVSDIQVIVNNQAVTDLKKLLLN